jgi:hypothetical protein
MASLAFGPQPRPFNVDPINYLNYAQVSAINAINQANVLSSLAQSLTAPVINPIFPSGASSPAISISPPPSLTTFTWSVPNAPDAFVGTLNVNPYLPDTFDEAPPVLSFAPTPAGFSETAPTAPGIVYPSFPTDPTIMLPAAPDLLSIATYQFGGVNLPTLDADVPVLNIVEPQIFPYTPGQGFVSDLLTKVTQIISDRLNGGTGLPPAVEKAIWDRGREREAKTLADGLAEVDRMEALGYAFPPGPWLDARIKLQTEFAAQSYGFSREVMIKQAELEQANIKNALDEAVTLESKLIDEYNMIEQRVLEGVKYATEAGIQTYNAKVEAYKSYVSAYQLKVAIYEATIKGEMSKVQVYQAEVEAERAKAEINTALVQQFKVQTDAALSMIELYKAQLAAVQTKAEIEKLKIEIYGEQVKAFGSKISAYTAGVEGYKASIQAEATKQTAYASAVEAYSAQVGAQAKIIDAKIAEYKGKLDAKLQEFEGYKAVVSAESERVRGIAQYNSAVADMYRSVVTGQASYNDSLTKQWQVSLEQAQRVAEIGNSAAKMNAELYLQSRGIAADAAKTSATVFSQLGSAALNALQWQTNYSVQNAYHANEGYNENHDFNTTINSGG